MFTRLKSWPLTKRRNIKTLVEDKHNINAEWNSKLLFFTSAVNHQFDIHLGKTIETPYKIEFNIIFNYLYSVYVHNLNRICIEMTAAWSLTFLTILIVRKFIIF